jgi:hypothetical protein
MRVHEKIIKLKYFLHSTFVQLSSFVYGLTSLSLGFISVSLLIYGGYGVANIIFMGKMDIISILNSVSYIIISLAIFDISRSIVEEELIHERVFTSISEARKTLTKFIVVIVIAISLESLILIILASKEKMENLIYPCLLMLTSSITIICLSVYQKNSVTAEEKVKEKDLID